MVRSGRFFLPGPTEVQPEILAAQDRAMIGHRGPEIEALMDRLQHGLRLLFLTDRPVVVSTSSATGLMEAAVRNGVAAGPVLSLVNGAFSQRFAEIAEACGSRVDRLEVPWGAVHDPEEVEERLQARSYDAVTLTHSETSTGALQDLRRLSEVVGAHPSTMLLVDSVTGVGGTEVRTDEWGLDFVLTGSQKALALPPGLAFGVASSALMVRSATLSGKGVYFDLVSLHESLERGQTPATPAISLMYALEAQLGRIATEGLEARWARHRSMRRLLVAWVEEMAVPGLGLLAPEGSRSPTVSCLTVPKGWSGDRIVAAMAERGFVIGSGYGRLRQDTVRIGHMGDHTLPELEDLLAALGEVLSG